MTAYSRLRWPVCGGLCCLRRAWPRRLSAQDFRGAISRPRDRYLERRAARRHGHRHQYRDQSIDDERRQQRRRLQPAVPDARRLHRGRRSCRASRSWSASGIEVRVGDRLTLDLRLELGGIEETISVTSATPLLDLSSASSGQVIDEKRIALLPLSDGNPFVLSRLVPGVAFTGDLKFSRPFDNAGTRRSTPTDRRAATSSRSMARRTWPTAAAWRSCRPPARCRSSRSRRPASTPATATPPARSSTSRSRAAPTRIKGQGYFYMRDEKLSATDFFVNKAGGEKPALMYNRFGGSGGGPLLPRPDVLLRRGRSGSTTSSPSRGRRPCPPRRCATATSRRCWRRASPFTIRPPRASRAGS